MEQTALTDIQKLKEQIAESLLDLRPEGEQTPPSIADYCTGWNRMCEIPDGMLGHVLKVLRAEIECRKRIGDEAYFACKSIESKAELYLRALVNTENGYINEMIENGSWVEFKQRFAAELGKVMEQEGRMSHER